MGAAAEHDFATYPRRFDAYRWFKPLLVGLLFIVFYLIAGFAIEIVTKAMFGASFEGVGYDGMDFFSVAGAFRNGAEAVVMIPCLILAVLIVKDRPISSYFSSMGGWRWDAFLKTLAVALVIIGIPTIVSLLLQGRTGDIQFTIGGFVILLFMVPLQGVTEELVFRGYIMQTVSSWFKLPVIGVIVQILVFSAIHPYNIVGMVGISVSALLYALVCIITKGIESGSAMHIVNNMTEIFMAGFGFGMLTSDSTIPDTALNLVLKIAFFAFIVFASKKLHWFDGVKRDDVAAFNAKGQE